ncbi:hypothetical protein ABIF38_002288 [Bradyrhizobium japonicum]|uniref:Uncharacterized protein n=1 Tax=Bradyrhizobium elkanii TaxID=29448 RepID=A0ABV4FDS4_BRAEL
MRVSIRGCNQFISGRSVRGDNPSPGFALAKPPSPTRGEGAPVARLAPHGATVTGEKSTNQLFGCTKPLTFGLIARGATSWAT